LVALAPFQLFHQSLMMALVQISPFELSCSTTIMFFYPVRWSTQIEQQYKLVYKLESIQWRYSMTYVHTNVFCCESVNVAKMWSYLMIQRDPSPCCTNILDTTISGNI
jgi:hypothetical protein